MKRMIRLVLALLLGAVFVYAGVLKVRDPMRFASDISNYQMLPWSVGVRLAFYLPWLEIVCGLALILQRLFAGALALTLLLVVVFTAATIWAKAQGIDVGCGCFGTVSSTLTLTWHLVLNGGLLAAVVGLWCAQEDTTAVAA